MGSILILAIGMFPVQAQIPDTYTNLKVLPADITKADLVRVMRDVATGLGVRCNHCHVGPENLQKMDFATDEKEAKRTARAMMRMMRDINEKYLAKIDTERTARLEVRCATCHRGQTLPQFIQDVVEKTVESDGIVKALARYKELREEYYGGFAYDFGPGPLTGLGEKLAQAGRLDDSLAILVMNSEFHPDATWNWVVIARVHLSKGQREKAIAALKKALEHDADNQFVKDQLEKLEAADEEG